MSDANTSSEAPSSSTSGPSRSDNSSKGRPVGTPFPELFPPLAPTVPTSHGSTDASSSSHSTRTHSSAMHDMAATHVSTGASSTATKTPRDIPERCLTFCSSRSDAPSMCRMFCLRKKAIVSSREEELARLRPPKPARPAVSTDSHDISQETAQTISSLWQSFTPLQSLRRTLAPYSIIYVKGTATGVVGRYMEELEADDGHRDFGQESRHADEKRGQEREIAWYNWGDEGSLIHVPLTSLFHPILAIPSTVSFYLSPPLRFLSAYRDSFYNGAQSRNANLLYTALTDGSAITFANKMIAHQQKKVSEAVEKRKQQIEAQRQDMLRQLEEQREAEANAKMDGNGSSRRPLGVPPSLANSPTGARTGGLRDRLEEAMERDRARKRDEDGARTEQDREGAGSSGNS